MNIKERQAIEGRSLLLFDGRCGMCNVTVRFLIRRDPARRLIYAPLESPLGQEMLAQAGLTFNPNGIVVIESALTPSQRVSARSDATVRTLLLLSGGWPWMGRLLSWVPRELREWLYAWVARRRYRLFGAYETCPIPSAGERALILGTAAAPIR